MTTDQIGWFDERYELYEKACSDRRLVRQQAPQTFQSLWQEILAVVAAAQGKAVELETGGSGNNRHVLMAIDSKQMLVTGYRRLDIKLSNNLRDVTVESDAAKLTFQIAVSPDGAVGFAQNMKLLSTRETARLILEPFLFSGTSPYSNKAVLEQD